MNTPPSIVAKEAEIAALREEIKGCSNVSPDTAYRLSFNLSAAQRSVQAWRTGKIYLSGLRGGVLVVGIHSLPAEKAEEFCLAVGGWKSHANGALLVLDGQYGEIRRNKRNTCWIVDLDSPHKTILFGWEAGPRETLLAGPRLNVTNGGGHWVGLVSSTTPINTAKAPRTVAFLQHATKCFAETGRTPRQQIRWLNKQKIAGSLL